jgi:hypothetical protein
LAANGTAIGGEPNVGEPNVGEPNVGEPNVGNPALGLTVGITFCFPDWANSKSRGPTGGKLGITSAGCDRGCRRGCGRTASTTTIGRLNVLSFGEEVLPERLPGNGGSGGKPGTVNGGGADGIIAGPPRAMTGDGGIGGTGDTTAGATSGVTAGNLAKGTASVGTIVSGRLAAGALAAERLENAGTFTADPGDRVTALARGNCTVARPDGSAAEPWGSKTGGATAGGAMGDGGTIDSIPGGASAGFGSGFGGGVDRTGNLATGGTTAG